jgi:hypothetical protein
MSLAEIDRAVLFLSKIAGKKSPGRQRFLFSRNDLSVDVISLPGNLKAIGIGLTKQPDATLTENNGS